MYVATFVSLLNSSSYFNCSSTKHQSKFLVDLAISLILVFGRFLRTSAQLVAVVHRKVNRQHGEEDDLLAEEEDRGGGGRKPSWREI